MMSDIILRAYRKTISKQQTSADKTDSFRNSRTNFNWQLFVDSSLNWLRTGKCFGGNRWLFFAIVLPHSAWKLSLIQKRPVAVRGGLFLE
ncbi:hypothetical protein CDAR_22281 [Caerostris darwini]|uniref:Uncharacterized protein n=1 Tax=Caerostris darwini TaxID=1538125 RepID=A0AAV4USQ9_9ARAC|nr:hypothetical protein CDAR_22281 [Caerostris darwini]